MKLSNFLRLSLLLLLASCANTQNNQLIIGKWAGAEWLVNGKASGLQAQSTFFTFDDKGAYTYSYLGSGENGTYKVENEMLFTTPAYEQEIMVKIIKLTQDTLAFEMNRSGQVETLTMLRK